MHAGRFQNDENGSPGAGTGFTILMDENLQPYHGMRYGYAEGREPGCARQMRKPAVMRLLALILAVFFALASSIIALAHPGIQLGHFSPVPIGPEALAGPFTVEVSVIGDSFTGGSKMGGLEGSNWTVALPSEIPDAGVRINRQGLGGSGYVSRGPNGKTFKDKVARTFTPDSDVVVIFGSINDMSYPIEQTADAISSVFAAAKQSAPDAKLVIIGPAWTNKEVPSSVLAIRDVLARNSAGAGADFIDPIAEEWFFEEPSLIGPDGVHPTDEGHAYIARKLAPHFARYAG